jgi:hypothetical protein
MTTITIPGLYDAVTNQLLNSPTIVSGDVTISVGGGAFVNTTNLPTLRASGSPVIDLVLTSAEVVSSAIVRFVDQDSEWIGPTVFDVTETGDATLAKQNEIIGLVSPAVISRNPVVDASTIQLIKGDTYDGSTVLSPKLSFATTRDYTEADSVVLVIHDKSDVSAVLLQADAVVVSSTLIQVELTATFDPPLRFIGYPLGIELGFALIAEEAGEKSTIARGIATVFERGDIVVDEA